jgi:hypothetical protein
MFLADAGNYLNDDITPCPRSTESSATRLLQPQMRILVHYYLQVFEFPND